MREIVLFILTNIKRSSSTCHFDTWSMGHSWCGCKQGLRAGHASSPTEQPNKLNKLDSSKEERHSYVPTTLPYRQ